MFTRRRFLLTLGALGVSKVFAATYPFPLGVASGYPSPDGMVLWTRLAGLASPREWPLRGRGARPSRRCVGGAGPVHACEVASLLKSENVIFPPLASVFSAFGSLVTPPRLRNPAIPKRVNDIVLKGTLAELEKIVRTGSPEDRRAAKLAL